MDWEDKTKNTLLLSIKNLKYLTKYKIYDLSNNKPYISPRFFEAFQLFGHFTKVESEVR